MNAGNDRLGYHRAEGHHEMQMRAGPGMRIDRLDAHDDAAMRAWHEVYLASHRHGRPYACLLYTSDAADE